MAPSRAARRRAAREERSAARIARVRDIALGLLASLGVATIGWLVVSTAFSLSLIAFVTGSMTPTMPVGAAAVVQKVDAAELSVGDVVTVIRPDGSPVTHRIVEIGDGVSADSRTLTLKGDANEAVDIDQPVVAEARRVLFAVPQLGGVVLALNEPPARIAGVGLLAALISWSLWPARRRLTESSAEPNEHPSASVPVEERA